MVEPPRSRFPPPPLTLKVHICCQFFLWRQKVFVWLSGLRGFTPHPLPIRGPTTKKTLIFCVSTPTGEWEIQHGWAASRVQLFQSLLCLERMSFKNNLFLTTFIFSIFFFRQEFLFDIFSFSLFSSLWQIISLSL